HADVTAPGGHEGRQTPEMISLFTGSQRIRVTVVVLHAGHLHGHGLGLAHVQDPRERERAPAVDRLEHTTDLRANPGLAAFFGEDVREAVKIAVRKA
ncbi:hypothetical protein, partial [Streptomyces sp. P17]|uniref:hypothetical protein n=1 Tax=Streptomyces sp. P17 TaxID=3074716 RepID=UPI0028F42CDB